MPMHLQSTIDSFPHTARKIIAEVGLLVSETMMLTDIFVHPQFVSIHERRMLLPEPIRDHIGNWFWSAAPTVALILAGEVCRSLGENTGGLVGDILTTIGDAAPAAAIIFTTELNLFFASILNHNAQAGGDVAFGVTASILTAGAAMSAISLFREARAAPAPQEMQQL